MTAARFDLYGALWVVCSRCHSGQWSRGYQILCRLDRAGYKPGIGLQQGRFESPEQRALARELFYRYRHKL